MIHKLDQVEQMFADADAFIDTHPHYLNMDVNEIFYTLSDDAFGDMTYIRWGVMTRAIMKDISSYDVSTVVSFIKNVEYKWDLLIENIAYVLCFEKHLDMMELLAHSMDLQAKESVFPLIAAVIPYVDDCRLDIYKQICSLLADNPDDNVCNTFISGYAEAVVRCHKEKELVDYFDAENNGVTAKLVCEVARPLCKSRLADAERVLETLLYSGKRHCIIAAAEYLYRSTLYHMDAFKNYYPRVETVISDDMNLRYYFIPSYCEVIISGQSELSERFTKKLREIVKSGTKEEKKSILYSLQYRFKDSESGRDLLEESIRYLPNDEKEMLSILDYYFTESVKNNMENTLQKLLNIYDRRTVGKEDNIFNYLPQMRYELSKNDRFTELWFEWVMHGNDSAFFLMMDAYKKQLVSTQGILSYSKKSGITDRDIHTLLMGVYLFCIDAGKLMVLLFGLYECVKDKTEFIKMCVEDIYNNYPGDMVAYAEKVMKEQEGTQLLASKVLEHHKRMQKEQEVLKDDMDFVQSMEHRMVDFTLVVERNSRINEMAEENSFFGRYFPKRMMKYGRKFGYFQENKNKKGEFKVSDYQNYSMSIELPLSFIRDPLSYYYRRKCYLADRISVDEIHC